MPLSASNDPNIAIESHSPGHTVYRDLTTGERWAEIGECNRCGLCMVGAESPNTVWLGPAGLPGACLDLDYETRPVVVCRPSLVEASRLMAKQLGIGSECSLRFEILDGHPAIPD